MTSENKPSWQYVPPTSQTENDVIDATRFMKGSSRKSEPSSSNVSSAPAAESNISAQPVDASSPKEPLHQESSPTQASSETPAESSSTQGSNSRQIEYASERAPQATEYSASSDGSASREYNGREYKKYDSRREYRHKDRECRQDSCGCSHSDEKHAEPKKKGFFSSIGAFFQKLFSGKKKEEAAPSAPYSGERRYDRERGGYRRGGPRGDFRRGGRGGGHRRFRGGRGGGPRRDSRPPQA